MARRQKPCRFSNKLSNSTRTLLWRMQIFQSRRAGCITAPILCQRGGRKRVSTRTKRCDCNQACQRGISHSDSLTTMAIVIISAPSPSLKSRNATCRTKPKPIWPSALFSDVRASGRNQPRIWKKQRRSIRKT